MKILFLLTQDIHSPSGLGRYYPLAKELVKCGNAVTIAALHPDFNSLTERQFTSDGVSINYVAQMHVLKTGNQKNYYSPMQLLWIILKATTALGFAAWKIPADIVIVGKPHPMNGIPGLLMKYLKHKKLIVDCDDYEAGSGRFVNNWQRKAIIFFEMALPKYADAVTTNTYFMLDKLVEWGISKNKIVYLSNGVDRDRFCVTDTAITQSLREQFNLNGKKVILYIGSLSLASHRVDLLIAAYQLVQAQIPDAVLLIIGGGEDFNRLKDMANNLGLADHIIFVGRVQPDIVPMYYRLGDVSTDPVSDDEAARGRSPLKLFESWACGIPFITADVGDRRVLIGRPFAGVLAQPGDKESLAKSILSVLLDKQFAAQIIEQGHERVNAFWWDILAINLEKICLHYSRR